MWEERTDTERHGLPSGLRVGLRSGTASEPCAPDPVGPLSHSCPSLCRPAGRVAHLGGWLTWLVPVAARFAVHTVVAAGVEALHTAHLALLALPRALGYGLLAWGPQGLGSALLRAPA